MSWTLRHASLNGILLSLILAACGGGGGDNPPPAPATPPAPAADPCASLVAGVSAGYASNYTDYGTTSAGPCDPRATADGSGLGGDGAGAGADGGGDGGAGAGSSEGLFRKAIVRALRADGTLIGQAMVDDTKGMVTIQPGNYKGPALIEIQGSSIAQYFDEAKGEFRSFGPGESLRVLIPELSYLSANLGMTPFTEAAVRYYVARGGSLTRLDAAGIRAANAAVLDAVNKLLPASQRLTELTRLPYLVGSATRAGDVQNTANGYYGIVLAGLAISGGAFNPAAERPAASIGAQLAADLADGVLDFLGVDGAPVTSPAQATYSPATLGTSLATAIDTAARRYADPALVSTLGVSPLGFAAWPDAGSGVPFVVQLQTSGQLVRAPGGASVVANGVVALGRTLSAGYAVRSDGSLLASGLNSSGQLGIGSSSAASGPVAVVGFGPGALTATLVAGGSRHALARASNGVVLAWGSNSAGQLGQPASTSVLTSAAPVPGAPVALSVAAGPDTSYLVSEQGAIYAWGSGGSGELGLGSNLRQITQPTLIPLIPAVVGLDCTRHCLAVTHDGKVLAWGRNTQGGVGNGTTLNAFSPADIGLTAIVTAVVDSDDSSYALTATGGLYGWGNDPTGQTPTARLTPQPFSATTPKMASLYRLGAQVFAKAQDGKVYQLIGSAAIPIGAGPAFP